MPPQAASPPSVAQVPGDAPPAAGPQLGQALLDLLRDPVTVLLRRWNWKAAALSILFRAPVYVIASLRSGWREILAALLAESAVCAGTAGFYGAFVQAARSAQPAWATALAITVFLPGVMQAVEYFVHWLRGTHHLHAVLIGSVLVSALSSLFNWFAMRRGTLLVGGEGKSFRKDLSRLPLLAVSFIISGPRWLWRAGRKASNEESEGPHKSPCREDLA
jgi:hypothetical protein